MTVEDMIKVIDYIRELEEDMFDEIKEELDYIAREVSSISQQLSEFPINGRCNLGLIDERDYPF